MAESVYDIVTPRFLATRWNETVQDREPYLLEAFFNETKQMGIRLSFLQGNSPKVRVLDLAHFDTKALPLARESFNRVDIELPYWKNYLPIDEEQRQDLHTALSTGNQQYIDVLLNRVYNDNKTLLEDAAVTKEMMRALVMTTGAITFSSNGQQIQYDYGVPDKNKITISDESSKWTSTDTSDPISDIISWQDAIETATGVRPKNLLMNRTTFNLIKRSASVKDAVYVFANGTVTPNEKRTKEFILEETGCTVYIYEKGYYTHDDKTTMTKFVPDNVVVLFPDDILGTFTYGTTPAEADLMSGATNAVVEIVDGGVAITQEKLVDPVYSKLIVSMIGVPTLEVPEQLLIATVA